MKRSKHVPFPTVPQNPSDNYTGVRPNLTTKLLAAAGIVLAPATGIATANAVLEHRTTSQEQEARSAQASQEIAGAKEHFRTLAGEVTALAHRFDTCKLTAVTKVEEKAGTSQGPEGVVSRDKVVVSLHVHQTEASKELETKYPDAKSGPIQRDSTMMAFLIEKNTQGQRGLGVEIMEGIPDSAVQDGPNTYTLYPKADRYTLGSEIAVFAMADARADTLVGSYREWGRMYCGTLERTQDEAGTLTWTVAPDAPAFEDAYQVEGIIPAPAK